MTKIKLKTCCQCKVPKHPLHFPVDRSNADGRGYRCKRCVGMNKRVRRTYAEIRRDQDHKGSFMRHVKEKNPALHEKLTNKTCKKKKNVQ